MFSIDKMPLLLLRMNLPQIFTVYLGAPKAFEDFQENILGRVILVYNRYSEHSVCNLTKRRSVQTKFSEESFENRWLYMAPSEQSEIAACNVIQFLTIKISFGNLL